MVCAFETLTSFVAQGTTLADLAQLPPHARQALKRWLEGVATDEDSAILAKFFGKREKNSKKRQGEGRCEARHAS